MRHWHHCGCEIEHGSAEEASAHVATIRPPELIDRYLGHVGGAVTDAMARTFWGMLERVAAAPVDRLDLPPFLRARALRMGVPSGIDRPYGVPLSSRPYGS